MNLVYNILQILFAISAIIIIVYDRKYQKIPFWIVIANYVCIVALTNYWLLLGLVYLIICKIKDTPIDWLFVLIMFYLIIRKGNILCSIISILICLVYVLISRKKERISYMVPLELAIAVMLFMKG